MNWRASGETGACFAGYLCKTNERETEEKATEKVTSSLEKTKTDGNGKDGNEMKRQETG